MKPAVLLLALSLFPATPVVSQDTSASGITQQPLPDFSLQVDELIDQQVLVETLDVGRIVSEPLTPTRPREAPVIRVQQAPGAVLRGLDKVSGEVRDIELDLGEDAHIGRLTVELDECRFPVDNPAGDAFAFLTIRAEGLDEPAFRGWMVASSPALSALDHPRYDVWVIRCKSI